MLKSLQHCEQCNLGLGNHLSTPDRGADLNDKIRLNNVIQATIE